MRVLGTLFITACLWSAIGGVEEHDQAKIVRVPNSRVGNIWCMYDGGTGYVTMHPLEPGVYAVHCKDGVVITGGNK